MFVKLLFFLFIVFGALNIHAQIYTLRECTYYHSLSSDPNLAIRYRAFDSTWRCIYDGNDFEITANMYLNEIIPCSLFNPVRNNDIGCNSNQVCNFELSPPACVTSSSTLERDNGNQLFNISQAFSICYVSNVNANLVTIDPKNVNFGPNAEGINEHCRQLLRIMQLMVGRNTTLGTINLPTSTTGI